MFTLEQEQIIEQFKEEQVNFEIVNVEQLQFSVFGLQCEIERIKSDIELSIKRQEELSAKLIKLNEKLIEVKQAVLDKHTVA